MGARIIRYLSIKEKIVLKKWKKYYFLLKPTK